MEDKIDAIDAKIFKVDNEPHVRSPLKKRNDNLEEYLFEGKTTIPEMLEHVVKQSPDKNIYFLRDCVKHLIDKCCKCGKSIVTYLHGDNKYLTYSQYFHMVQCTARGLKKFVPDATKVGFLADTSLDWVLLLHSCMMNSLAATTMGANEIVDIVNQCKLEIMLCPDANVKKLEGLAEKMPSLKKLIVVGNVGTSEVFELTTLEELMKVGSGLDTEFKKPKKDDLALIMFTSGTTGQPKGVMITHNNMVVTITGMQAMLKVNSNDVYISYLPMAHIFEQLVHHLLFFNRGLIGFGGPRTLMAKPGGAKLIGDIGNIRPTIMCGVPRVWETIKKAVEAKVRAAGGISEFLFNYVYNKKLAMLRRGEIEDVFLEAKVFGKVRAMFGGRLRTLISGGAALSKECNEFLQISLGKSVKVIQGYAATETCCAGACQYPIFKQFGGVGKIGHCFPCVEMKLESVPELGYSVDNDPPQGEICIKSPGVTMGYFNKPELTKEVFEEKSDGVWYHSGDIGQFEKDGQIVIIDRKKNLVKLSHGEYVALEHLECIYGNSKFIMPNGLCVIHDPFKDFVVAVILADVAYAKEWSKVNGIGLTSPHEIIANAKYLDALAASLEDIAKLQKKSKWERVKHFRVYVDMWGPHNDTTTPSFKLKRRTIKKKYEDEILEMFSGGKKPVGNVEKMEKVEEEDDLTKNFPSYFSMVKTY